MKKTWLWILLLLVLAIVLRGVKGTLGTVTDTANKAIDAAVDGADGIAGAVADGAAGAVDAVADGAAGAVDAVADGAAGAVDAVADGAAGAVDAVVDGAADVADTVVDGAAGAIDTVVDGAAGAVDAVVDGAADVADTVVDGAAGAVDAVVGGDDVAVNIENSTVTWAGRSGPKNHVGTVAIKTANISMTDDVITGGSVVLDMTTIVATDIDSDGLNDHLKADDFFDVENHPTATFSITSVDGDELTGDLTIRGTTLPVTVPFAKENEGARATFSIDGTKWGVNEGGIKDALVSDTIDLEIFLAY